MDIIKKLAQELAIKEEQAKAAVQLIDAVSYTHLTLPTT